MAFVIFDPPEFVQFTIEIISGIGERKSFDGDSRRVLQAVRHVYADAAVRVALESVRGVDVDVDVSDAHVYYSVHRFLNSTPVAVDHLEAVSVLAAGWARAPGSAAATEVSEAGTGLWAEVLSVSIFRISVTVRLPGWCLHFRLHLSVLDRRFRFRFLFRFFRRRSD